MRVATFRDTALNVTYCFHPRRFPCQHQRLPTDLINFEGLLSEDERAVAERAVAERVRAFVQGYGCAGLSAPQYGLAM